MISIIVPVFNTGTKLNRCIKSIQEQTYVDWELFLIDDGSDTDTANLCDEWSERENRIYVRHIANQGVSAARNIGIDLAHGEWLYFMDSDDYAEKEMLDAMQHEACSYALDMVICGYYDEIPGQEAEAAVNRMSGRRLETQNDIRNNMVSLWDSALMYNVWNKLFRAKIIKENKILFPNGKPFNEDRDFVREYLYYAQRISVLDASYYHYIREDQLSAAGKYREDKLAIREKEYDDLKLFFHKYGIDTPEAREYVAREHFDRVVGCVEELFHYPFPFQARYNRVKNILTDKYSVEALKNSKAKSKMMKVIHMVYATRCTMLVYMMTYCIYLIRDRHPNLFYKLRQRR